MLDSLILTHKGVNKVNTNLLVQEALKKGTFFSSWKNGVLSGFKPETGMTIVFKDGSTGIVLRSPNSCGDFKILDEYGDSVRVNLCSDSISGYLR